MLWRPPYEPRVFERVPASSLPLGISVGIFDPRGQFELGVWLKLLESEGLDRQTAIVAVGIRDHATLEALLPPSRHPQLIYLPELAGGLSDAIKPDRPERAFAAIVENGVAKLIVVGAPTEDVWERFQQEASS